ncbi:MAG: tripartite tricarboxylate transporter TctB family protein [Gammaproteobacteria bacterium]|nr:tripartite tricarboxylate transporter TctB family protein [Gammaproteobacteria bacterium]MBU0787197.1 tripartite tricarboxylate transporter TctB family protein [Gammaproteobacteria bacterium]MBU0814204.1 tripartite tricarboxylate transporter TctB family protein [Gammaproteobacteria bacterium]MBU1786276.1 tripartite tricarboxylate transporter TctB family protein [Gammaproteobacteria bacterium]
MAHSDNSSESRLHQTGVGFGILLLAGGLAYGALFISSEAGYAGVGPNFLPWVVATALLVCGIALLREALQGGFRDMEKPSGADRGDWAGFAWLSAGVLLNAALITRIGFVFSCALCFVLAVRGLRVSDGKPAGSGVQTMKDIATGLLIAAPVFWMFTKLLNINLPGLTGTGWL